MQSFSLISYSVLNYIFQKEKFQICSALRSTVVLNDIDFLLMLIYEAVHSLFFGLSEILTLFELTFVALNCKCFSGSFSKVFLFDYSMSKVWSSNFTSDKPNNS